MAEDKKDGGGGGDAGPSRVSTLFPAPVQPSSTQARQRFTVELKPDETTIISWKKLVKESNKSTKPPPPATEPPSGAHPALETRIGPPPAPGQPPEGEGNDAPTTNRFSAVIEKIERLYVGNESSEEEELANVPDDDQYDTEDSFIDDADLDEYFQVDESTTKHKGFFVNRGTLERITEHSSSPKQQPKKRRRKDLTTQPEKDDGNPPNKHTKVGNVRMKTAARNVVLGNMSSSPSPSFANKNEQFQEEKFSQKSNVSVVLPKKKPSDANMKMAQHVSSEIHNDRLEAKDSDKQKIGVVHSRDPGSKLKISGESSDAHHTYQDKSFPDSQSRRLLNDSKELEPSKLRQKEKNSGCESPSNNISRTKNNTPTKSSSIHSKDGSSVRPKGTIVDRAIRDLEDIVKEARPPTLEMQDADSSSQGIKRRLPREVKQKLAKVARLAQSSQGKISDELITRLMSIVGHIMQRKTLKRNLREMVVRGLSAKQEKDVKFQQIKNEMVEMIKVKGPYLKSKVSGLQDGACDDFQEVRGSEEKEVVKVKGSMDNAMEDKLCDLYDLYVEGMDEDKSSQVRKLYAELAELWPSGTMDNHGIKSAVCRSKARKRATHNRIKNLEKVKQQKPSSTLRVEDTPVAQARLLQEKMATDISSQALTSPGRLIGNVTTVQQPITAAKMSQSSSNGSGLIRPKQEKLKESSGAFHDDGRRSTDQAVVKKKVKRKAESDVHFHRAKLPSQEGRERQKLLKQDINQSNSDVQLAGFTGSDRFS